MEIVYLLPMTCTGPCIFYLNKLKRSSQAERPYPTVRKTIGSYPKPNKLEAFKHHALNMTSTLYEHLIIIINIHESIISMRLKCKLHPLNMGYLNFIP